MKKRVKIILIIIATIVSAILFVIWMFKYRWEEVRCSYSDYTEETSYGLWYNQIKEYQDKKIIFDMYIKSGIYKIAIYKVPEDHLAQKFHNVDIEEYGRLYAAGYRPPTTTEGMEYIESYVFDETGVYTIDTKDWELGLYAIETQVEDFTGSDVIRLRYKYYNWLDVKWRLLGFLGIEDTEEERTPY